MRLPGFVCFCLLAGLMTGYAQTDSSFSVVRDGDTAVFPFRVYKSTMQMANAKKGSLPVYGFDSAQVNRIHELLSDFVAMEEKYEALDQNNDRKDSLYQNKLSLYVEMDSIQELRVKNYEQAYQSMLAVNNQLNAQVENCEKLALRAKRKAGFNSLLIGTLTGLSVGMILEHLMN